MAAWMVIFDLGASETDGMVCIPTAALDETAAVQLAVELTCLRVQRAELHLTGT